MQSKQPSRVFSNTTVQKHPARAPGPSPALQSPSLHLEGFSVADPDGLRDVGQGGILPAGFKGIGTPRSLCSPPPSTAGVHMGRGMAGHIQGVEGAAADGSGRELRTWGRKGMARLVGGQSSPRVRGKAGGCARVTAGPKRPHVGVCPGPTIPLQGRQGSRGCIPGSPGESGLVSRL